MGEGVGRVGGPVAAGFGDFDEAGSVGERRVADEVRNIEHFVAKGGDEQEIDLFEDAGHLERNLTAKAVGLDIVHGGEKTGLTEDGGPGVGRLDFELVEAAGEGQVFEAAASARRMRVREP